MKGPSLPAMRPPAMERVTPSSLNTSVFRPSSPACQQLFLPSHHDVTQFIRSLAH